MVQGSVLIAEDNVFVARSLARIAREYGPAIVAATLHAAWQVVAAGDAFAAFLVDLNLPDGSGLDFLRGVRATHPLVPSLMLSGDIRPEWINSAHDLGARCAIKPVNRERVSRFLADATSIERRLDAAVLAYRRRYAFTEAETDVLRRTALGEQRISIAMSRGTSIETVNKQVTSILCATNACSMQSLVVRMLSELAQM